MAWLNRSAVLFCSTNKTAKILHDSLLHQICVAEIISARYCPPDHISRKTLMDYDLSKCDRDGPCVPLYHHWHWIE
jgi:hypothetical protein